MSQRINLNDNVDDRFPFSVGGYDYDLRYPTLQELEPIVNLSNDRKIALDAGDNDKVAEIDKKMDEAFYGFIVPANADQPPIKDVLKTQNMKVVNAFNKMIQEQLAVE